MDEYMGLVGSDPARILFQKWKVPKMGMQAWFVPRGWFLTRLPWIGSVALPSLQGCDGYDGISQSPFSLLWNHVMISRTLGCLIILSNCGRGLQNMAIDFGPV